MYIDYCIDRTESTQKGLQDGSKVVASVVWHKMGIPNPKRALELANLENNLLNIFPDLWEELGETIRNLVARSYRSVFRSLRWLIESAIFWMYLELDKKLTR
jgi:hypothetical protein